ALHGPLDAHSGGIDAVASSDFDNHRIFGGCSVFRSAVAFRAAGRTEGAVADRLNAVVQDEFEEFGLLKVRVQFHLVGSRLDAGIAQHELELGNGHVGGTDA